MLEGVIGAHGHTVLPPTPRLGLASLPARDLRAPGRAWFAGTFALLIGFLAASVSAASRPIWTANRVVGSPNPPSPYTVGNVFPGIRFQNPVDIARLPGTDRLAVAEQSGRIWSFVAPPGMATDGRAIRPDLMVDLRRWHEPFDSVLGFTFHPGFATNRFLFVNYNEPGGRENGSFVSRFTLATLDPPTVDPASEKVILRWLSGGHNGCALEFGPDGTLYISTGDGASPDPPDGVRNTGQDISDLLGAILRIDVDHPEPGRAYSIPRDNPFVDVPKAAPEVWAFGFRNPFRMSFDRVTGELWAGDVGWEQWEMIHRIRKGGNYGWAIAEGPNRHVRPDLTPGPGPILPPVVALPHNEAASITAGRAYHGRRLPGLRGAFVYGDWETGKFWALRTEGDRVVSNEELCDTTLKPVAFAEDHDGELLVLDYGGGLHRFLPNPAPPANEAFPRRLGETGLFADTRTLLPAPGVVPYSVLAPLWSDGARADHLLGIPGDARISTADGREVISGRMWYWPSNTVVARTLSLETVRGEAGSRRRVETQMLHFDGQGWNAYTFRWRPDQSDADLVPVEGTNTVVQVQDAAAPGGRRELAWRFLGRAECFRCHNVWAGELLSFNWQQLGHPSARPESESARLARLGVFEPRNPPQPSLVLVPPHDVRAPLEHRARSWLHANCAGCHRFGAGGGVALHLNFDKPPAEWRALDELPTRGDFGLPDARIVARGDPWRSTLVYRINTESTARMPHIGSRLADPEGARLVADWIRTLAPPPDASRPPVASDAAARLAMLDDPGAVTNAVPRLLESMDGALALLDRLANEARPVAAPILAAAVRITRHHTNSLLRDLYQRLLPPDQRRATLGPDFPPSSVLALVGDAVRGQEVFGGAAQCVRCHVRDGHGRAFGPDLTGIGNKYNREQLLDQLLFPSRVIAPEFKSVTLTLKDETERVGFVLRRTATGLVLKDANLVEHEIPMSSVAESRESALSAMPEGILAPLTAQEAADLLEYLRR